MFRLGGKFDGGYVIPKKLLNEKFGLISAGLGDDWKFEIHGKKMGVFTEFISIDHTISLSILFKKAFSVFPKKFKQFKSFSYRVIVFFRYLWDFKIQRNRHLRKRVSSQTNRIFEVTLMECADLLDEGKLVLKIDIEGDEYSLTDDIISLSNRIALLIIEFHSISTRRVEFENELKKIKNCFTLVHVHGNNFSSVAKDGVPDVLEMTFINNFMYEDLIIRNKNYREKLPLADSDSPNNPNTKDIYFNFR